MSPATLFDVTADDVAATTDDWYTPRWLFKAAGLEFDLDVAAPIDPAMRTCPARSYLTAVEDGLTAPWHGLVWMNPPFSKPAAWVDRWTNHPDGMALLPAVNSPWRGVLLSGCEALTFVTIDGNDARAGRGFSRPDGTQASLPFALILASRGIECTKALARLAMEDRYSGGAYFVKPF